MVEGLLTLTTEGKVSPSRTPLTQSPVTPLILTLTSIISLTITMTMTLTL